MSYCESCGRELRAGAAFCGSCGAKALPAPAASPQVPAAPSGYAAQPPATAAAYAPPVSAPAKTSGTGVALVVIGAAMTLLFTFVSYGWYSASYAGGGADQGWVFSFGAWAWTGLWPPNELFSGATSWPVMVWLQQITWIAAMITTLLCVAAAVLALLRAAGARVGGGVIRAFGIAAAIATVAYMVVWATSGDYRWLAVTDLAALVGAVLIIIGGGLLGSAAAPYPSSGAPLPARGPGDTH